MTVIILKINRKVFIIMKDLYFAACDRDGGIYHYKLDGGALTFVRRYDVDRPMWLTISGSRMYVLLRELTENLNSGVMSFDILPDGSLVDPSEPVLSGGRCACHSCVHDGRLYLVNYLSGNVCAFDADNLSRGVIAEDLHDGKGLHPTRQEAAHTHFVRETPDGKYLFCVDLGVDTIFTYDKDLHVLAEAKVPDGEGCRHLEYSPDGKYVYCANELGSSVTIFSYSDGKLSRLETYPALPSDFDGQNTAAAVRISADGKYLYVSNRGHDSVCAFDVTDGGKRLGDPLWTKVGGVSPRDINLAGGYLFAANEKSRGVTIFSVDGKDLKKLDTVLSMKGALCTAVR